MVRYMTKRVLKINPTFANQAEMKRSLELAQKGLDNIVNYAERKMFQQLDELVKNIKTIVASNRFPSIRRSIFNMMIDEAVKQAYIKEASNMIKLYASVEIAGDSSKRQDALNKSRAFVNKAIASGARPSLKDELEKVLEILKLTTKPGIDDIAKKEALKRTEVIYDAPDVRIDRRKALRFFSPRLSVFINNRDNYTLDWSMYGLRIFYKHEPPKVGSSLYLQLSTIGMDEPSKPIWVKVVRVDQANSLICVEFESICTVVLNIAAHLKQIGMKLELL
ncbi:hypothetical protein WCLP8_120006 [uncultured Gammaproteobacteria bacterium]